MNAKVEDTTVTVTIDDVEITAPKGASIIQVADEHGIDIPRFCYHRKLSVPANCRMCLVDVEMGGRPAPKPLPACATTIGDGMVVRTASDRALKAQRGVMEFLLINHPLDCPICDQGGECELQDLSLGYGRGVSRFTERKRIVKDEDLGPLISTEMTRCIHCTRCVRFLDEVAGNPELGGMFRGEHMEIGTYVGRGVHSELSGNIIDLCPVGALTSKPFRFTARAWELLSHPGVAPHDAVGSNIAVHHRSGRVMRVVPRDNDAVNETWISDRDRFSYQGLHAEDRLSRPLIKRDGEWQESDWETALEATVSGLRGVLDAHGADQLGALISPSATLEEMYLIGRLMRALGSDHVDHRLRQADFRDDAAAPAWPYLGLPLAELERQDAVLLIGSYARWEAPMLNHRLRKAVHRGGRVLCLNPRRFEWNLEIAEELVTGPQTMVPELALVVLAAAAQRGAPAPDGVAELAGGREPEAAHRRMAEALSGADAGAVILGHLAESHPDGASLRALGALLAELSGASYGTLGSGANSAGGWLAGAVPHRRAGGEAGSGLDARAMLENPRQGYLLFGMEPEYDCWDGAAAQRALAAAQFVAVLSPWASDAMRAYADVILPVGAFTETAGTLVNAEGDWQTFAGVAKPVGEARPAWRLLRVLGNLLDLDGFDYNAPDEIHHEIRERTAALAERPDRTPKLGLPSERPTLGELVRVGGAAIYGIDPLIRRAAALQQTGQAADATVVLAPETASGLGLADGGWARVRQGGEPLRLPVVLDAAVPAGTVWIGAALPGSAGLGPMIGEVAVEPA